MPQSRMPRDATPNWLLACAFVMRGGMGWTRRRGDDVLVQDRLPESVVFEWAWAGPWMCPFVDDVLDEVPVPGQHVWLTPEDRLKRFGTDFGGPWASCLWCGKIKLRDGVNKPCVGIVRIGLR